MNRKESLELFEQGENAWNTWANDLLAEKNALKLADIWMGGDKNQWNDETRSWHKKPKPISHSTSLRVMRIFVIFNFQVKFHFKLQNFKGMQNSKVQSLSTMRILGQ